jgi:hypothetical protein
LFSALRLLGLVSYKTGGDVREMSYYLLLNDEQKGPYTIGQLRAMWRSGAITADAQYWEDGLTEWLPVSSLADQLDAPQHQAVHSPQPIQPPALSRTQKKKASGGFIMSLFRIIMLFIAVVSIWEGFSYPIAWGLAIICLLLGIAVKRVA